MLLLLIRVFNDLDMETCVLRVDWEMKMLVMALEKAHASLTFGGAQYIWNKTEDEKDIIKYCMYICIVVQVTY